MSRVVKPQRSANSIFNEQDVYFIYENILLVCESDRKAYGDEQILFDAAARINSIINFDFVYKNYEVEMQNPNDNVFYFSADAIKQGKNRKYTMIVKKWYKHLRNAFAHNCIRIDNGAFVFEDFLEENGRTLKQTMYARVTSLEEFKRLVLEIKNKLK